MKKETVVLVQVESKTQQLQELIRRYEGEISLLLNQKSQLDPNDPLFAICEIKVLGKQEVIHDLRGVL